MKNSKKFNYTYYGNTVLKKGKITSMHHLKSINFCFIIFYFYFYCLFTYTKLKFISLFIPLISLSL